jgi:heat shock protein HtpX
VLIGLISYAFGAAYNDYTITIGALIGSVIYALISYYSSSKLALAMNGAKEIQKRDNMRLWRIVENLTIINGMPMPRVYIIEDRALNAFATGRDPEHAVVAATTGLLERLDDQELQGVMAHELGHVKNYDIRVSMIAFALVAVVSLLADFMLCASFYGRQFADDDDSPASSGIMIIFGIVAMILAPLLATLIQLAISRQREYLADATGAMTTRYPEGLARALEKISDEGSILRRQNASTAHFFIANPLKRKSFSTLFSTHPPVEDRVARLRGMDKKL